MCRFNDDIVMLPCSKRFNLSYSSLVEKLLLKQHKRSLINIVIVSAKLFLLVVRKSPAFYAIPFDIILQILRSNTENPGIL